MSAKIRILKIHGKLASLAHRQQAPAAMSTSDKIPSVDARIRVSYIEFVGRDTFNERATSYGPP